MSILGDERPIRARHQNLPRPLCLVLEQIPLHPPARPRHVTHERDTGEQPGDQERVVDRAGVVVEGAVSECVETRLREVAEAGQADYQAVDFAKGGEAEDFRGVIAVEFCVSCRGIFFFKGINTKKGVRRRT